MQQKKHDVFLLPTDTWKAKILSDGMTLGARGVAHVLTSNNKHADMYNIYSPSISDNVSHSLSVCSLRVALRLWFGPCVIHTTNIQCNPRSVCATLKRLSIVLFNEHRLCYLCHQLTRAHTVRLLVPPPLLPLLILLLRILHALTWLSRARCHSLTRRRRGCRKCSSICLCISGLARRNHHNTHSKIILNRCFAAVFRLFKLSSLFPSFQKWTESCKTNNNTKHKPTERNTVVVVCAVAVPLIPLFLSVLLLLLFFFYFFSSLYYAHSQLFGNWVGYSLSHRVSHTFRGIACVYMIRSFGARLPVQLSGTGVCSNSFSYWQLFPLYGCVIYPLSNVCFVFLFSVLIFRIGNSSASNESLSFYWTPIHRHRREKTSSHLFRNT